MASLDGFSPEEIQLLLANLDKIPVQEQAEMLALLEEYEEKHAIEACRTSLIAFSKRMNPNFLVGPHHKKIAAIFEAVARGEKKRVIINIAPRHGKSELSSYNLPSWYLGNFPHKKIIMSSHTAELATGFGRRVRNLMDTDDYKVVFPGVGLSADSKAAGRWASNKGGEYFACLRRFALVRTDRGTTPAGRVRVGDRLATTGGWVTVKCVYNSEHTETFTISGLRCSAEHPVWTMNRGWVYAKNIVSNDVLCVESIWDRMYALTGRVYGYLEHTDVSALVQHKKQVHKRKQREVEVLRWAWDRGVRALACLREFYSRYGAAPKRQAHDRSDRCERAVQPGELPVGNVSRAGEQQTQQRTPAREYTGRTCPQVGGNSGSHKVQNLFGCRPSVTGEETEEELRTLSSPENIGWLRRTCAHIITRCGEVRSSGESEGGTERDIAGAGGYAQIVSGFFMGVRTAGPVSRATHREGKPFVNFLTDGDHTFFADGVLTHNCGVGGALAGRGGDLVLIDDPVSEQDAKSGSAQVFIDQWEWFQQGLMTRVMPGGAVVVLMTRWSKLDLSGQIINHMTKNPDADQWEIIELPAVLPSGAPLWPEFWSAAELEQKKIAVGPVAWAAQYMQQPTSEGAQLLKKEWWRHWDKEDPPDCVYTIMSLDAAQESHNRADYNAMTLWGVFYTDGLDGRKQTNVILLNAWRERMEFPELKKAVLADYEEWQPDTFIVEKKSNGAALYQELRRMGLSVTEFTPGKGQDKISRVNAISDMLSSGMVWAPTDRRWASELIEECAEFPLGANDDQVDSTTQALMRIRQGGFLQLPTDYEDTELPEYRRRSGRGYY